jgi:16S rRNA processing protein RimM
VRIGRVGRPHGTDGAFSVSEPTDRIELLDVGRRVFIGGREGRISARKGTGQRPIVKLEGADPEPVRGQAIEVPRAELALNQGEYLIDDLIGCDVVDRDRHVGRVTDVLALPAADALEVERTLLVPMVSDAVRAIDIDQGRIDVDMAFLSDE